MTIRRPISTSSPTMIVSAFTGSTRSSSGTANMCAMLDEALAWAAANRAELYSRWLEYSEQE